ncbi:MAG: hypothetical protein ACYDDF_07855 [Thermoplasmatota archaeon]
MHYAWRWAEQGATALAALLLTALVTFAYDGRADWVLAVALAAGAFVAAGFRSAQNSRHA